jgi:hypothetical protein
VACLYEDRAVREAQYEAHRKESEAALATCEAKLQKAESILLSTTKDYLKLKRDSQVL